MNKVRKVIFAMLVVLGTVSGAEAATIKELQGAWAMKGSQCEEIFKKVGKSIQFKDRLAPTSTGMLFTGNRVTGPMAICTITQIRRKTSRLFTQLSCETAMIVEQVPVSFDMPSSSELRRFDLFGGTLYVTYQKCNL